MATLRRGVQSIRTMGSLVDNRKVRTPAGALLEMSAMANEKLLLQKELARWDRRHLEIRARLSAIAAKERRLLAVIQGDPMPPGVQGDPPAGAQAAPVAPWLAKAEATPDPSGGAAARFKVQELSY